MRKRLRGAYRLTRKPPARLVAHLPHQPVGRVHVRKQQRVAHLVQREAKPVEPFGGNPIELRESVVVREPVIGGEPKSAAPHLRVVLEVRATTPDLPMLDVVGEKPAHPESVVPQVCADEKRSPRVRAFRILEKRRERIVLLVIGGADARCAVLDAEMHEDGGDVVGEGSVIFSYAAQRMSHDDIAVERERCPAAERLLDEGAEQSRIIEHRVDATVAQHRLGIVGSTGAGAR